MSSCILIYLPYILIYVLVLIYVLIYVFIYPHISSCPHMSPIWRGRQALGSIRSSWHNIPSLAYKRAPIIVSFLGGLSSGIIKSILSVAVEETISCTGVGFSQLHILVSTMWLNSAFLFQTFNKSCCSLHGRRELPRWEGLLEGRHLLVSEEEEVWRLVCRIGYQISSGCQMSDLVNDRISWNPLASEGEDVCGVRLWNFSLRIGWMH